MTQVWCESWKQLVDELQSDSDTPAALIGCVCSVSGVDLPRVANALVNCRRKAVEGGLDIRFQSQNWTTDEFQVILSALMQNGKFTSWSFNRFWPSFDDCKGNALCIAVSEHPQLCGLCLDRANLSVDCMRNLAMAMLHRPTLRLFFLPHNAFSYPEVVTQLVRLRRKFSSAQLAYGENMQRQNSLLAKLSVYNEDAEKAVRSLQRQLLDAFTSGNLSQAIDILNTLTREVAHLEHERLLKLLPDLSELSCMLGGMELLRALPSDFDDNAEAGATGQFMPKPLTALSTDGQVSYLLALATYKDRCLTQAISEFQQALAPLAASENISESVEAVCQKWCLAEVFASVPSYHLGHLPNIVPPRSLKSLMGDYSQCGYFSGLPCYVRSDRARYLYHIESTWIISGSLGNPIYQACLPDESPSEPRVVPKTKDGDKSRWVDAYTSEFPALIEEREPCKRALRDAVVEFLKNQAKFKEFLTFKDIVMKTKLAPLKTKGRAVEKGPQWLLDTNRCTFCFESPALMVLGFFVFQKIIEAAEGKIVRFNNYFFKDGLPNLAMTKPPCLHINFMIESWTYEAMFSLQTFIDAKEVLHKYFEITRCKHPIDLLMPVFNPHEADEAFAEVLHANLPGSKSFGKAAKQAGVMRITWSNSSKGDEVSEKKAEEKGEVGEEQMKEEEKKAQDAKRAAEEDKKKLEEEINQLRDAKRAVEEEIKQLQNKAEAEKSKRKDEDDGEDDNCGGAGLNAARALHISTPEEPKPAKTRPAPKVAAGGLTGAKAEEEVVAKANAEEEVARTELAVTTPLTAVANNDEVSKAMPAMTTATHDAAVATPDVRAPATTSEEFQEPRENLCSDATVDNKEEPAAKVLFIDELVDMLETSIIAKKAQNAIPNKENEETEKVDRAIIAPVPLSAVAEICKPDAPKPDNPGFRPGCRGLRPQSSQLHAELLEMLEERKRIMMQNEKLKEENEQLKM